MFPVYPEPDGGAFLGPDGCGRCCCSCSFLAFAKLAGQRGGGDVAVYEREAPVNGPVVLQAGEGQNLFNVQEVAAMGKG